MIEGSPRSTAVAHQGYGRLHGTLLWCSVILSIVACSIPFVHVDQMGDIAESVDATARSVLRIAENGEVLVRGVVEGKDVSCGMGARLCHLLVRVDGARVHVYPFLSAENELCSDNAVSDSYDQVSLGDVIEAYGVYFGRGRVSVCGHPEGYLVITSSVD